MIPHLPRFLVGSGAEPGAEVELDPAEAKHVRVRRLGRGAPVALFDGGGRSWVGRIERLAGDGIVVRVERALPADDAESPLDITLAVALLKADRLDRVIEKATELGVAAIQPFASRFSLAQPSAARQARWREIARSAAKQSGRSRIPRLAAPLEWNELFGLPAPCRLLLWEGETEGGLDALRARLPRPAGILLIVGPEGGFAPDEVDAATAAGCHRIGLGPRVLRSDTAALAAVALCQYTWGDLDSSRRRGPARLRPTE